MRSPSNAVLPSIEMDGSAWVSSLPGWKSGGSFHTLLLGVTELFKVNAHWLSTTVSAGASSATTPSNLMMILGFVPASQFART